MTRFRVIAEKIKERIEAEVASLCDLVTVFHRADFESRVEDMLRRSSGRSVTVRVNEAVNVKKGKASYYVGRITVTLFTVPMAAPKDTADADEVISAIEAALQGWWPPGVDGANWMYLHCAGVQYPPEFKLRDGTTCAAAILTLSAPGNVK